jgi:D-glycero-alpha-D-manno-heptose-7-phosphate kinase
LSFDLKNYQVDENDTIKNALLKVEANHDGIVFVQSSIGEVVGVVTDGDIRRALLEGVVIEDSVSKCMNRDFAWASVDATREQLIKRLDSHIKFIPILDESKTLHSIISRNFLPLSSENATYIRSRAPVRVSFGGGGSDLTHYFESNAGAVINAAISIYSHATMKLRNDAKVKIVSRDLKAELVAENLDDALSQKGRFGLIQSLLSIVRPSYGFELYLHSDFPVGSGLGGSATVAAVVLGCFNMLRTDQWNCHELSEIAFQAERLHLGIAGGWQDQYAAVFGGFNFIEFHAEENIVHPIRIHSDVVLELEESLLLCNTGAEHHSGNIHDNQKETMGSEAIREMVSENVDLSYATRNHLLKGELRKFGECLGKSWELKRNFSRMISNEYIDSIYTGAIQHGAVGGKLLGAGGGGFFLFYVPPFKKNTLIDYLESENLKLQAFRFEPEGLKAWTAREH